MLNHAPYPQDLARKELVAGLLSTLVCGKVHGRRPSEECDQVELLAPAGATGTGTNAVDRSGRELGIARFGLTKADNFAGVWFNPFEARGTGDVYALTSIRCLRHLGRLHIGARRKRYRIGGVQKGVTAVDAEITGFASNTMKRQTGESSSLGLRRRAQNRLDGSGHSYWFQNEEHCEACTYNRSQDCAAQMRTGRCLKLKRDVQGGRLPSNEFERGPASKPNHPREFRDSGVNRTVCDWEKSDFMPRPDAFGRNVFTQSNDQKELGKAVAENFFAAVTEDDLARERQARRSCGASAATPVIGNANRT